MKATQTNLQKCLTWPKKSGKGKQEWTKVGANSKIHPRKLNTQMKTRFFYT
jgi:hypothetical protein